ncbi:MAG: peptide/nickel transport system substrate-binding protein [Betaproteobacteria bacterium]|nr:peptide/nickel transport system substrate-binding protein [Betaproteobacteria bacterium]
MKPLLFLFLIATNASALIETPMLKADVDAGKLPPVEKRLPQNPRVMPLEEGKTQGRHGGTLQSLAGRSRDTRLFTIYGYARMVVYSTDLKIVPDIVESFDVVEGRIFTFRLRKGHRWSDGQPFTSDDFRYYWEDVANNQELSPSGPPRDLLVDGEAPKVEILNETTIRYAWAKPNPSFLPRLAGTSPLFIFRPAHYLKQFHKKYSAKVAKADADGTAKRKWSAVHNRADNMYEADNPDLPSLQPWINTTRPPADRFVAVRNAYFHRVDASGRQLPYVDRFVLAIADSKLIPAKTGAGEADLQARDLNFNNYTFLKQSEKNNRYRTLLWRAAKGSHIALFPNLNVNDPVWRQVLRDVRFRRALSLAIDRSLVNQVLYFGLAIEANNTILPGSPLYRESYKDAWARYDRRMANRLLDEMGLKRGLDGTRRLPDGRKLEIIIETAGESSEQTDVLELVRETWREVGIAAFSKPSQREAFRNRVFAGETVMSVWSGIENGLPTPETSPDELAPTSQLQLQWPKFGQWYETSHKVGDAPDIPEVQELASLYQQWRRSKNDEERARIWQRMLEIHAEQQFTIGVVSGVPQPVIARESLMNVPKEAFYNWDPGAFFGIYHPDMFWFKQ